MDDKPKDGGNAFPACNEANMNDTMGMSLRDYFAGQALCNPNICNGQAPEYQLQEWFGNRTAITRAEITARQAYEYADAMTSLCAEAGR